VFLAFREREMSSPAIGSLGSDRIGPATRLVRSRASTARIPSAAKMRRLAEVVVTASVLMLIMFGGLALRAALSLVEGVH